MLPAARGAAMHELLGWAIYRAAAAIRGERTFRYLAEYVRTERRPAAETAAWQREKLTALVEYAAKEIPFYRDLGAREFADLPVIEKRMLKDAPERFVSRAAAGRLTVKVTSGSTSEPTRIVKDAESMAREQAASYRAYRWTGIAPGARQARFWGVPLTAKERRKHRLRDALLNRVRLSAFNYTDRSFEEYLRALRRWKPAYLYGYTSVIHEFARYLAASGAEKIPLPGLRSVITTAEILTPRMREEIVAGLGAPVFDEYGCAETGSIAHDCEEGSLHINAENLFVEVLGDDGVIRPAGEGRLLLSELHNRAQPLLRYDSGDYGELTAEPCRCGRTLPVLKNVHGRVYDTVIGPEGRRYNAAFFSYIFKEAQHRGETIRQFQVIQNDRTITFRIVKGKDFTPAVEELLARQLEAEFGDYFAACFEYREKIERERSGKLRQLIRISPAESESSS